MAPATVRGAVFLPALLDVENEAGPVLVAEVRAFRLVSVPSMMRIGKSFAFCRYLLMINAFCWRIKR